MQAAATSAAAIPSAAATSSDPAVEGGADEAGSRKPSATWENLVHQDSSASVEADQNIVAMREDSVALAHRRLGDRLYGANDSVALHRKRLHMPDQPRESPTDARDRIEKKSPGVRSALRSLSATIKGILPGERRSSAEHRRPSADEPKAEDQPNELRRSSVRFADVEDADAAGLSAK